MSRLRDRARASIQRGFASRPEHFGPAKLAAPALVFAAHADDETLGCGGTIATKLEAGAHVVLVVVSDGAAAEVGPSREELVATRREEALAAASELGLSAGDVHFLEFPDGGLAEAGGALPDAIGSLLAVERPAQLFVPWRHDGHADHEATLRAVLTGARGLHLGCEVFEYPVWAWRHWPWVRLRLPRGEEFPPWRATAKFAGGWRFPRVFTVTNHIEETLGRKRAALACYQSQLDLAAAWSLSRVSRGEFLACFDQPFEVFRRGRLRG